MVECPLFKPLSNLWSSVEILSKAVTEHSFMGSKLHESILFCNGSLSRLVNLSHPAHVSWSIVSMNFTNIIIRQVFTETAQFIVFGMKFLNLLAGYLVLRCNYSCSSKWNLPAYRWLLSSHRNSTMGRTSSLTVEKSGIHKNMHYFYRWQDCNRYSLWYKICCKQEIYQSSLTFK